MFTCFSGLRASHSRARRHPGRKRFRPVLEALESLCLPSSVSWTLQGDGNFNDPNNWTVDGTSPPQHRVPGPGDHANIPGNWTVTSSQDNTVDSVGAGAFRITGGTFTVTNLGSGTSIGNLILTGGSFVTASNESDIFGGTINATLGTAANATFRFHRGTTVLDPGAVLTGQGNYVMNGDTFGGPEVALNGTVAAPPNFELANGVIDGTGTLNVGGTFNVTTGSGAGGTTIAGNLTININSGASFNLAGQSGDLVLDYATLNNDGAVNWTGAMGVHPTDGAQINNLADGTLYDQNSHSFDFFNGTFTNSGTYQKSAGTTGVGCPFVNSGMVAVTGGVFQLARGGTNSGAFSLDAGGVLNLATDYTLDQGTSIQGGGITDISGGTIAVNGDLDLPNLTLEGGTLTGSGTITVSQALTWTGGAMGGSGTTVIPAESTFTLNGPNGKILVDTRTLNNATELIWNGTGSIFLGTGTTFQNTGTVTVPDNQAFQTYPYDFSGPGTVVNVGTFALASQGTANLFAIFNNSGTVDASGGTLQLFKGGTNTGAITDLGTLAVNGGTFTLDPGSGLADSAQVNIEGGTLLDNADVTVTNLQLDNGTLGGTATLTVAGSLAWTNGTMNGSGTTLVAAGGALAISGSAGKLLADTRQFINGTDNATWDGGGNLYLTQFATFTNDGTLTVLNNQTIESSPYDFSAPGVVNNAGNWIKTSGGTTNIHVIFNNSGTVDLQAGALLLNRGGSANGTFDTAAGVTLSFTADYTLNDGASLVDTGFARVQGGTVTVAGSVTATDIGLDSGTLAGPGTLEVTGSFDWTGGSIADPNGTLLLDPGATMSISGTSGKTLNARTLDLNGDVTWSGGNIAVQNGGIINLGDGQGDGTFTIQTDNLNMGGSGTFRNKGIVTMADAFTNVTITGIAFLNDDPAAVLSIASGTLAIDNFTQGAGATTIAAGASLVTSSTVTLQNSTLDDNGSFTVTNGDLILNQGAVLSGVGAVTVHNATGKVDNVAGTVCPGECDDSVIGTLTIAGNYVNEALGSLSVYIDGTDPSSYDQLVVTGTVTLNGGTVNVTFGPDYTPTDQDSFTVLTSQLGANNGNPGDFEVYNVNGLDPSFQMTHSLSGGGLTLTVQAVNGAPAIVAGWLAREQWESFGVADEAFLDLLPTW